MAPLTTKDPVRVLCEIGELLGQPWETKADCIKATEIARVIDEYLDPDSIHTISAEEYQMIRCKFTCSEVASVMGSAPDETGTWKPAIIERVKLSPASGRDNSEWSAATPSGDMTLGITNPKACGFFKPGKSYYIDIQEVEQGS